MSDDVETQEETTVEEVKPIAGIGTLVFGKYDAAEVVCRDPGLAPYINLSTVGVPHTGGRHANAWFGKARLVCRGEIHKQTNAYWKVHWEEDGCFESVRERP